MKAVILSGGSGSRGLPFTKFIPKAMIPCNEKPMIYYIVQHIINCKLIDEIMIITDLKGLGGQIQNYFYNTKYEKFLTFIQDSKNGTGGDLNCIPRRKINEPFLLWFGDNLCAIDIMKMRSHFNNKTSYICIATRNQRKEKTGFAKIENGAITQFIEKPIIKFQMSECLGIYIMSPSVLDLISKNDKKNINLSYDILQKLVEYKNTSTFDIGNQLWIDIESPTVATYNKVLISSITKLMEC